MRTEADPWGLRFAPVRASPRNPCGPSPMGMRVRIALSMVGSAIAVFDSGVGGLALLREVRRLLPSESFVYLGDTARVPYGTKSHASIRRYALQAVEQLVRRDIKLLVVACNTVSAIALTDLQERLHPLPVVGVIDPAVDAAVRQSQCHHYLVLGTEGTVERKAYSDAFRKRNSRALVEEVACSILVALAEEGWTCGPIADAVVQRYLEAVADRPTSHRPDCVVLGCTHFGFFEGSIRRRLGEGVRIIDSATTAARAIEREVTGAGVVVAGTGELMLLATDHPERFARVGGGFLGEPISSSQVELVDL